MLKRINDSVNYIRSIVKSKPSLAMILGTGLGDFVKELTILKEIPYQDIPYFPATTVDGHEGKLVLARHGEKEILIMQGRIHYYEGLSMDLITYPVRVLKFFGIDTLFLSNAGGGMNENFKVGDIMLIEDHINFMPNPLIGEHIPEFGARFPDMSDVYDKILLDQAGEIARNHNLIVHRGVYLSVTGPTYETPAEYRFFHTIGADAVGMSTVPEAIVARQMGMRCFALSVITDLGVPGKIEYLTHEQVQIAAHAAEPKVTLIIKGLIDKLR